MSRQAYEKSGKKTSPQRKGHQKTDGQGDEKHQNLDLRFQILDYKLKKYFLKGGNMVLSPLRFENDLFKKTKLI